MRSTQHERIAVHDEVADALASGRPVVALETAVVTAGLPRDPLQARWADGLDDGWSPGGAVNHEAATMMERAVRRGGAVPATVAVVDGRLRIGLEPAELAALAGNGSAGKASVTDLAALLATGGTAGTTVSATLAACRRARPAPIRVFATGGIGGVHRGWTRRPDVSADLVQIARCACCVVSAGAKSILDAAATLEALETLGVPVIGLGTSCMPQFVSRPDPALRLPRRVDDAREVAPICATHWTTLDGGGILVAVPVDDELLVDRVALEAATCAAEAEAAAAGIAGAALTPHLLADIARRTGGQSLRANLALLRRNAEVAASIAVAVAGNRS